MQKSRRWRGLELDLLSLVLLAACAAPPPAAVPVAPEPAPTATTASAPPATSSAPAAAPESEPASNPTLPAPAPVGVGEPAPEPLPKGTRVLQLGDSFAAALGGELAKLFKEAGVRSTLEYKTASYIPNWSYEGDVPKFVANYQPDLVLITLGANEIEIPKPEERIKPIKHLVSTLGGRPCVWIAPPLWKPDTGLLNVIRDNVAPCRYLDSNALVHDLPRGRDKIHPSAEGRQIWAKIVFDWLAKERIGGPKQPWALKPTPAAN
ncbi:MAG TPA: SGNH/GDSL hydrolase family protein [Polyangiaceae bacterium]|nr:SGNH/GDSL hydrolase family protein [Polyangiaceae bacterium]